MRWLVGLCIGVLALILWRLDVATTTVNFQKQQLTRLQQSLADKKGQLTAINLMAQANDRYQVRLQQQADALSAALTTKDKRIKELINENAELKSWADTPLPADVIRLRERPALAGGATYREWLSQSDAVSPGKVSAAQ